MTEIKPQPTNVAAERAVLAGLCQHGQEFYTDVLEFLSSECFTQPLNQNIYRCIEEILKNAHTPDYPSIVVKSKELGLASLDSQVNQEYIAALFNFKTHKDTAKEHAISLRRLFLIRKAQNTLKDIYYKLNNMSGSEKLSEILDVVEKPIYEFSNIVTTNSDDRTRPLCEDILGYIEHVTQNKVDTIGIPSPWPRYNEAIGGGRRRGGVYITAARPKVGKSGCAINDAVHCAYRLKTPILYLDTEMSEESQLPRILAKLSKLKINSIESGNLRDIEIDKLKQVGKDISNIPLYYRKIAGKSFQEIVSIVRNFIVQVVGTSNGRTNDCLVIYDYFKLMDTNDLNKMAEYQAIGFQIQELSNLCIKYDFPCSSYIQLNRQEEVSQSDRILWLCSSLAVLKRKSGEEIALDGLQNGNTKLIVSAEQRFGPGLEDGDYINLMMQRDKCIVEEVGLKSQINSQSSGFDSNDQTDSADEEF